MAEPYVIPVEERAPQLKEFLVTQTNVISNIRAQKKNLIPGAVTTPFLYLVHPWIVDAVSAEQESLFAARRKEFGAAGFNGAAVSDSLGDILQHDRHLRECCVGRGQLAHCFDIGFVTPAASLMATNAPAERLDELYQQFVTTIYCQGRFKAISLCHIFNFHSDEPSLQFGDVRLARLDSSTISRILGETSFVSFIHPPGTGEYFIVSELEGPCDDHVKWLFEQKNKAELFMHVLQYFKDGVIHIDSAVPHFMPQWVNEVRKWGLFFIGNPRRLPYEGGRKVYTIRREEREAVARWWAAYQKPEVFQRISDLRHTLRQAGLRAGEYYELNHKQENPTDRLISLAIALEALFSPDDKGEFTFRISQSLSQLVGSTEAERTSIFRETKKFYARRSELVHGQYDVEAYLQGNFVTHLDCDRWASPIRQAILRFLVLYIRGRNNRADILNELSLAALNAEAADKLRSESLLERLFAELKV